MSISIGRGRLAAAALVLLAPLAALAAGQVGEMAAAWTLTDTDGVTWNLSDGYGEVQYLHIVGYN